MVTVKLKRFPLGTFMKQFSTEVQCLEDMANLRWQTGYVYQKCNYRHTYRLANGWYQCVKCRHQVSVTAGTVFHKTHMPLTQWFLAFYFVCQDKRGIPAVQLETMLGTAYRTAWFMLKRIRIAIGQRDETHLLCGVIEFDNAYFGGPTTGKKRGRGTEKAKVFMALSLDERGNPFFLKMRVTPNLKQASVKRFAHAAFADGNAIHSDGYRSYIPALEGYTHERKPYVVCSTGYTIVISNAKAFILGTYHGLPKKYFRFYLDEYPFRFNRRGFGGTLVDRLTLSIVSSRSAE